MAVTEGTTARRRVAAHPGAGDASPAKAGAATAKVVMAPKYGAKVSKVNRETAAESESRGVRARQGEGKKEARHRPRILSPREKKKK